MNAADSKTSQALHIICRKRFFRTEAGYNRMALEQSTSEDEGIKEVNTDESEDIDLAALMERYQGSLSVSVSGEECKSLSLKQGESEDEYAARANEIMQRYKMQYVLSEDTEQVENEMGSNVNSKLVEKDVFEQVEPPMLETESYEVEIGEEIQEEESSFFAQKKNKKQPKNTPTGKKQEGNPS